MINPSYRAIKETLPLPGGGAIVLYDMLHAPESTPTEEFNRNIYRMTASGDIRWQVSAPEGRYEKTPFTNVYFTQDGKLKAFRWDGFECEINMESGEAFITDFLK